MASCKFHLTAPMTHLEHCLGNSIQFQEQSIFTWHELCFATARLLPVQAINYCHLKCSTGTHGHTLTTSILLLFSSFYFVSKSTVTCCSEQGTRPGSAVKEKRVERVLWFEWEELGFTWGGAGTPKGFLTASPPAIYSTINKY